jgi:hypothetical protein
MKSRPCVWCIYRRARTLHVTKVNGRPVELHVCSDCKEACLTQELLGEQRKRALRRWRAEQRKAMEGES